MYNIQNKKQIISRKNCENPAKNVYTLNLNKATKMLKHKTEAKKSIRRDIKVCACEEKCKPMTTKVGYR